MNPKPKNGDRKMIGNVLHVREIKRVHDCEGNIIGYHTGGRQRYEWMRVASSRAAS